MRIYNLNERFQGLFDYIYYNRNAFILFTPITCEGEGNPAAKSLNGLIIYNQFITLV